MARHYAFATIAQLRVQPSLTAAALSQACEAGRLSTTKFGHVRGVTADAVNVYLVQTRRVRQVDSWALGQLLDLLAEKQVALEAGRQRGGLRAQTFIDKEEQR